ncbi:MAG: hypothetical protein KTR23_09425 [Rhodospirillales bacterium]|nr:hypothetical protein [Rhodospirillales bacterium]
MEETILSIKRLLFAYSSIFLVLAFAIIQSDHEKYDRALLSVDEIQKLTAKIEGNFFTRLANPQDRQTKQAEFFVPAINQNVIFEYSSRYVDYSITPPELQGSMNGFSFARSSVEEFPDDFLKFERVVEFVPPLQPVSSLRDYMPLHDTVLLDARFETFVPELTKSIRAELYRQPSRAFNVIDQVSIDKVDSFKIIETIDLKDPVEGASEKTCKLSPIRTELNDVHGFMCHVAGVNYEGTDYSARLFMQAESTIDVVTRDRMLDMVSIPAFRQANFEVAHRELAQLAAPYPGLQFDDLYKVLETEKNRTPTTVSVLGAQVNIDLLLQVAFGGGAGFFLYVLLHLKEFRRRMTHSADPIHSTWVAIYPGFENLFLVFLQLFILPSGLLVIVLSNYLGVDLFVVLASFSAQMISGILVFYTILGIRRSLNGNLSSEKTAQGD